MFKKLLFITGVSTLGFSQIFNVSTVSELKQALQDASFNLESNIIELEKGNYEMTSSDGSYSYSKSDDYNLTIKAKTGLTLDDVILVGYGGANSYFNYTSDKAFSMFNLTGNSNSSIVFENLTIKDNGNTNYYDNGVYYGGAIKISNSKLVIRKSKIENCGSRKDGGAIYSNSSVNIESSILKNNKTGSDGEGGAVFVDGNVIVDNSTFQNNSAGDEGGAIHTYYGNNVLVKDSLFINNSISSNGDAGAIYSKNAVFMNSLFYGNNANKNYSDGGVFSGQNLFSLNTSYFNNYSNENHALIGTNGYVVNSVLFDNDVYDFKFTNLNIHNSFIETGKVDNIDSIKAYENVIDDQILEYNASNYGIQDYNYNFLIDKGLDYNSTIVNELYDEFSLNNTFLTSNKELIFNTNKDINGNDRVIGSNIDIGAFEFDNSINPKVVISYIGETKLYSTLTVNYDITLSGERTISEVLVDHGEGHYITADTSLNSFTTTFNSVGEKIIKVKVVDSEGSSTEQILDMTIHDLTTEEAIEYGKQQCISNPTNCGITVSSNLTKAYVSNLSSGWHMVGTASELFTENEAMLDDIDIVWFYSNDSERWSAYSKKYTDIKQNEEIDYLNTIPSNSGFWIKK